MRSAKCNNYKDRRRKKKKLYRNLPVHDNTCTTVVGKRTYDYVLVRNEIK